MKKIYILINTIFFLAFITGKTLNAEAALAQKTGSPVSEFGSCTIIAHALEREAGKSQYAPLTTLGKIELYWRRSSDEDRAQIRHLEVFETTSIRKGIGSALFRCGIMFLTNYLDNPHISWTVQPLGKKHLPLEELVSFYQKLGGEISMKNEDRVNMFFPKENLPPRRENIPERFLADPWPFPELHAGVGFKVKDIRIAQTKAKP